MANCNNLFKEFNTNLNISETKRKRLIKSRDSLRSTIIAYFKLNHPEYKPTFRGQGSYAAKTMIRIKSDTCDLDNGIFFSSKPKVSPKTLQKWVHSAVKNSSSQNPQHREKCIRVVYKNDYHIDLPIYYQEHDHDKPLLATKNEGWLESDPKEFKDWFIEQKDATGQLQRIVKYLKAWADYKVKKMPNGLIMTVLATRNIFHHKRDDIALLKTLESIEYKLTDSWSCHMPTEKNEDLLSDYTGNIEFFFESLEQIIADAKSAINHHENQLKASKIWRKHLGAFFPEGKDKNVDSQLESLVGTASAILTKSAKLDRDGRIQNDKGVEHKPHKNYGGQ